MSRWLLALLLTVAGAPHASARDALTVIDGCIRQLDPAVDVGYARISERCPDLAPSLAASPWAPWLPLDWNKPANALSAEGLTELRLLLTRPAAPLAAARAPRVARLGAVLAGLDLAERAQGGWWVRFKQWLREIFTPRPRDADRGWLRRLIGDMGLSETARQAIVWGALAVVVALAAAITANELRVAGLLGRRARRSAPVSGVGARPFAALTLLEVDAASPAQQPRLLLELIVARLRALERLPPARALTVHELARAARLPDEADRVRLAALAATCERVRFAARETPPAVLAAALACGRELLGSLEADACASG